MRGVPKCIRSDNGSEFIDKAIRRWLAQVSVETLYIEPGSPCENGFAESFHSRLRDEFFGAGDVREPGRDTATDRGLERRLQPSPTARLVGARGPGVTGRENALRGESVKRNKKLARRRAQRPASLR